LDEKFSISRLFLEGGSALDKCRLLSFKLFHLCVLFRAHVSTLLTFSLVSLGRHAEKIRSMLLSNDAGSARYSIFGYVVIHHETKRLINNIISSAQLSRVGNLRCYGFIYGGVEWWVGVAL
jgi:hypothetical protein